MARSFNFSFKKKTKRPKRNFWRLRNNCSKSPQSTSTFRFYESTSALPSSPSANSLKKLSPTKAEHVYKNLYGRIAAVLDGGSCKVGLESTILDLTQAFPTILRKRPITKIEIENILGCSVLDLESHGVISPGNIHLYYQPYTNSFVIRTDEYNNKINENIKKEVGLLYYSFFENLTDHPYDIRLDEVKESYAAAHYSSLHYLDNLNLKAIYIEEPPWIPCWDAVKDRLIKATN